MNRYSLDELSFMKGRSINLTEDVCIRHPLLNDIEEIGYEKYNEYLSSIVSTSLDVADVLWYEMEIWYEDIKSEWDFFIQKCISNKKLVDVKIMEAPGILSHVESECVAMNDLYRDALNYFLNIDGEFIVFEQTINDISQTVLYNAKKDKYDSYYIDDKSFKFTQFHYEIIIRFLKDINWIKDDYDFTTGGNKLAKKYMLKQIYDERERKRKRKRNRPNVTLDSIVSSLISKGHSFSEIWNYPIYLVYDQYYREIKIREYDNTMSALHSGCIDTKKNPINWEKINWSSIIN